MLWTMKMNLCLNDRRHASQMRVESGNGCLRGGDVEISLLTKIPILEFQMRWQNITVFGNTLPSLVALIAFSLLQPTDTHRQ